MGKALSRELYHHREIIEKKVGGIETKMTLDAHKLQSLERTNGYLKRKVGTLKDKVTSLKTTNDKLIILIKEHLEEQVKTNTKINILYENDMVILFL